MQNSRTDVVLFLLEWFQLATYSCGQSGDFGWFEIWRHQPVLSADAAVKKMAHVESLINSGTTAELLRSFTDHKIHSFSILRWAQRFLMALAGCCFDSFLCKSS